MEGDEGAERIADEERARRVELWELEHRVGPSMRLAVATLGSGAVGGAVDKLQP